VGSINDNRYHSAGHVTFDPTISQEREELIKKEGLTKALALFPNLSLGPNAFYSANHFGKVKRDIENLCDVSFKLKDFRPTLPSLTVNGDLSRLPAMSAQLRHSSYSTTQRYYLKMEQGAAGKQLKDAWKNSPIPALQNAKKTSM
jgi:integrase